MSTAYDPKIIIAQADRLYSQAASITIFYVLFGALGGPALSALLAASFFKGSEFMLIILLGAILGGLAGFLIGQQRGLELRFRAQIGLCQLQTEFNTRPAMVQQPVVNPQQQRGAQTWIR